MNLFFGMRLFLFPESNSANNQGNEGVKFYPLGSGNSDTQVLCLDLDYIPLWLAKIAITPTMQKENPELVNKLIDYQLKA